MQGFSHGCKLAVIDAQGVVLACTTVHPFASKRGSAEVRPEGSAECLLPLAACFAIALFERCGSGGAALRGEAGHYSNHRWFASDAPSLCGTSAPPDRPAGASRALRLRPAGLAAESASCTLESSEQRCAAGGRRRWRRLARSGGDRRGCDCVFPSVRLRDCQRSWSCPPRRQQNARAHSSPSCQRLGAALLCQPMLWTTATSSARSVHASFAHTGASVYSASQAARDELGSIDVTLRGAVSIARRCGSSAKLCNAMQSSHVCQR